MPFCEKINELLARRRELFQKASESYHRGGLTGSQSAVFFSDEAKRLESQIDELKDVAHLPRLHPQVPLFPLYTF